MLCRHRLASLAFVASCLAAAACGSNSSGTPDAPVVKQPDAPPPPDAPVDALVCTAPEAECTTGMCTNTNTDEQNCGSCGNVCQGGAYCDATQGTDPCHCPGDFLPNDLPSAGLDTFFSQAGFHIGVAPTPDATTIGQLDALIVLVNLNTTGTTVIDTDYTLKSGFSFPSVLAAYNIQAGTGTPSADAEYQATAGTIRFSKIDCASGQAEFVGTIKNATFSGVTGTPPNVQVDPNGCSFTVDTVTFDIKGSDSACP